MTLPKSPLWCQPSRAHRGLCEGALLLEVHRKGKQRHKFATKRTDSPRPFLASLPPRHPFELNSSACQSCLWNEVSDYSRTLLKNPAAMDNRLSLRLWYWLLLLPLESSLTLDAGRNQLTRFTGCIKKSCYSFLQNVILSSVSSMIHPAQCTPIILLVNRRYSRDLHAALS